MMYIWPDDIRKAMDIQREWLYTQDCIFYDEADWSKAPPEVQAAHKKFQEWEAIHKSFETITRGSPLIEVREIKKRKKRKKP